MERIAPPRTQSSTDARRSDSGNAGAPASGRASGRLAVPASRRALAANLFRLCMFAFIVTVASHATAEEPRRARTARPAAKKPGPCAAYGPGFTMLPGTTTCVRIGGSVVGDFGAGQGAAPNLGVK